MIIKKKLSQALLKSASKNRVLSLENQKFCFSNYNNGNNPNYNYSNSGYENNSGGLNYNIPPIPKEYDD